MSIEIIPDEDGVIKGFHASLVRHYPLEKLEREIYKILSEDGELSLSGIWKRFDCHLWEISYVLKRLKEKGLIEEKDISKTNNQQSK